MCVVAGDMTSRHPAILGLRNILKAACCNDVTSIAIPLLLRHEITEVDIFLQFFPTAKEGLYTIY